MIKAALDDRRHEKKKERNTMERAGEDRKERELKTKFMKNRIRSDCEVRKRGVGRLTN